MLEHGSLQCLLREYNTRGCTVTQAPTLQNILQIPRLTPPPVHPMRSTSGQARGMSMQKMYSLRPSHTIFNIFGSPSVNPNPTCHIALPFGEKLKSSLKVHESIIGVVRHNRLLFTSRNPFSFFRFCKWSLICCGSRARQKRPDDSYLRCDT